MKTKPAQRRKGGTMDIRTRFAPSPTGDIHLGNANTALFNYLLARSGGGKVALRIEDTDVERSRADYEERTIDTLRWLGLDWDEGPDRGGPYGPYRQSERLETYAVHVRRLIDGGHVYRCYCTREELVAERGRAGEERKSRGCPGGCRLRAERQAGGKPGGGTPFTVRFRTPDNETVVVNDMLRGEIAFRSAEIDDFIIVRSSGAPVFLLTNLVDDALMGITHVVRGEDHISNTPKQLLLARAFGYAAPEYLHTAVILGPDRSKLSKRHGAVSVEQFRREGYLPEALVNYLAFLGWNPKDEREIFPLGELVREFSVKAMSRNPSVFDHRRLLFLNGQWMRTIEKDRLVSLCSRRLVEHGYITAAEADEKRQTLEKIVAAAGARLKTVADIVPQADFFLTEDFPYDENGAAKHLKDEETAVTLEAAAERLRSGRPRSAAEMEEIVRDFIGETGVSSKKVIHPLRMALTGRTEGPGLFEIMEILGEERARARIARAVEYIRRRGGSV
ncbi:MAG: glutamate--tRNA ligase [bacterium]